MSGGASDGIATFISPIPLGGMVGRCAAAVAVSTAHYRSISSLQPSCSLPLSHGHNHLATVRVEFERTCILGLAPLSRSPLRPWLVGSHQRHRLLAITRRGSLSGIHTKGFWSGIRGCRHPLCLPVVACISTLRAKPCRPCGGWCGKLPDVPLFIESV